jgi:hypothetical protein
MREYIVSETLTGAFRTLEDALFAIKATENELETGEAIRLCVQGLLPMREPMKINPSMLPSPDHPIFIEGADGNSGFSGGMRLTGFTHFHDNLWRVQLPEVEYTRNLYIDGKTAKRPTTPYRKPHKWDVPKAPDYEFSYLPGEQEKTIKFFTGRVDAEAIDYSGIATTHTEIANYKNVSDLEMVFEVGWVHRVVPVESVQSLPDGRLYIKPKEPAFHSARFAEGVQIGSCPSYIENVFELLGKPLEWYFDRTERMLYVGLEDGDTPENHEIVLPHTEQLFEICGTLSEPVRHLTFKNLRFMHTGWLFPHKYGVPEIQANQMKFTEPPKELLLEKPFEADCQKVISAIRVLAAKDVNFENCTFTQLGTGGLQFEFGAEDCRTVGNHFYEIGGNAVILGDFYLERAHHPKDTREIVRAILIANNYIHDIGRELRGSVAIIAGYVQDVEISHNEICDVPYSAISIGWGWGESDISTGPKLPTPWTEPSVCMRNIISYNHIFRCMMSLSDGGAIYALGCMDGTKIEGNYIHESSGYTGDGYGGVSIAGYGVENLHDPAISQFSKRHGTPGGIYLDEGCRGIDVCGNLLHDVAIPLHYHNQIDDGYKDVCFVDNILNKKPGDVDFPTSLASRAGLEPSWDFLKEKI